jgi:CO dehydrogenase/acetyl-CoA synthase alpha subunit
LANTINSLFTKKLEERELLSLVAELQKRNFIVVKEGNVSYKLPSYP